MRRAAFGLPELRRLAWLDRLCADVRAGGGFAACLEFLILAHVSGETVACARIVLCALERPSG